MLFSLVLCASVTVTDPPIDPIETQNQLLNPPQTEQYEGNDEAVSLCDDSGHPNGNGDTN